MSSIAGSGGRAGAAPHAGFWTADQVDTRLRQGRLGPTQLDALARTLAAFHARRASEGAPGEVGRGDDGLAERVLRRARALRAARPDLEAPIDALVAGAAERVRSGAMEPVARPSGRRLHGALDLARIHVAPDGGVDLGPPVRGRVGDPARDVAALMLQLAVVGHPELAERWLAAYAGASGDWALYRVIDLHERLAALELAVAEGAETHVAGERAEAWLRAARCLPGALPRLVAVGGVAAEPRSTLAAAIGEGLGAPVLGNARSGPAEDPRAVEPGLSELLGQAEGVLASGRLLVIDAPLATVRERAALRALAARRQVPLLFIECRAGASLLRSRRIARAVGRAAPDERSEATAFAAWEAVAPCEFGRGEYLVADASRPSGAGLARVLGAAGVGPDAHRGRPRVLRAGGPGAVSPARSAAVPGPRA
jgi:predicted kinase